MATQDIQIGIGALELAGTFGFPTGARGLVLFAHGSGSSRHSPRNRHVAQMLHDRGLATLLLDLLTPDEEYIDTFEATLHPQVEILAERLVAATDSVIASGRASGLPIGYFGGSTGGAAALMAAARRPNQIAAVVARGGRLDLATACLPQVKAPTLLIVGGEDLGIAQINREAVTRLTALHRIVIVNGATHLFEEPGALDQVGHLAANWFLDHFHSVRPSIAQVAP